MEIAGQWCLADDVNEELLCSWDQSMNGENATIFHPYARMSDTS
jgi:hypothetical protein